LTDFSPSAMISSHMKEIISNASDLRISVIICCYSLDRLKDLHEAIDSALDQSLKASEVIVSVDHNQKLFERLRKETAFPVKIILNEHDHGAAGTRNFGIQQATGKIVAFLDDDSVAAPTWLENLVPNLNNKKIMGVGGRVELIWPEGKIPFWFPEEFDFMYGATAHKKLAILSDGEIRNVNENNAAFGKDLFQEIGYMEPSLGRCYAKDVKFDAIGGEGAEFCLRMKIKYPDRMILFEPSALTYHKVGLNRGTTKYMFNYAYREGITRAMLKALVSRYGQRPLAAENLFLRRVLFKSIPARLRRFYKVSNLACAGMILLLLTLIAGGYVVGTWKFRRSSNSEN
jgi:glycosyltransferase involved in cell wall biosynthesis